MPAHAAAAEPDRPFEVGFADSLFAGDDGNLWAQRTARAGANAVRINVYWSVVAPHEPDSPRLSDDPAYDFEAIDRAVLAANSQGLDVLMTVLAAPPWAEGPHRPDSATEAPPGTWRPDPDAYGDFAHAIAQRYSGFHPKPDDLGPGYLPEVDLFAAWNEPNITTYLSPQYVDGESTAPEIYAGLLNAFYAAVKNVNPDATVSTGGTAPFGDPVNHRRTSPLAFWRGVMCLTEDLKADEDCPMIDDPATFDVLAHHPISYLSSPAVHAADPDDMTVADFGELGEVLRAAESEETIDPDVTHRLIVPEIWWETKPGERRGISGRLQARYTALAMYLLWKQGADGVWFLQVRDAPVLKSGGGGTLASYQTGIFTYQGRKKPVYSAIGFPLVTERLDRRSALAWGRAPRSGQLLLQVKRAGKHGWTRVAKKHVEGGSVFTSRIDVRGRARVRARIGSTKSLPWRQAG